MSEHAGGRNQLGLPADLEVVIVHGWWHPDDSFACVADCAICPDGTLHISYDQCPDYGYWDAFVAARHVYGSHIDTLEKDDGYRPQEEEEACQGVACWTPGDWAMFCHSAN